MNLTMSLSVSGGCTSGVAVAVAADADASVAVEGCTSQRLLLPLADSVDSVSMGSTASSCTGRASSVLLLLVVGLRGFLLIRSGGSAALLTATLGALGFFGVGAAKFADFLGSVLSRGMGMGKSSAGEAFLTRGSALLKATAASTGSAHMVTLRR